ncbi:transcriptional repressor [Vibrio tarriae]|uniref:Transcriptional repressor n=1 Tax=Vibrio tarriae TaxID=2014742 RepID=A0AAU8WW16_9VIBR|nr:transcriptional repressor [Vibrio tarriae]ASK56005.1 transcriptional repressor [Vibrio tarriae]
MRDIEGVMEQAEKICLVRGKQLTTKRRLVLSVLLHANKPLSAYEIVDYCNCHFSQQIQAMSVYRILDFLVAEHFVHKLNISNKYIVCSHIERNHEHSATQFLICAECGKVREVIINARVISSIRANARQEGYTVINPQFEITCVCDDCSIKQSRELGCE